jgi:hypothetical protein
MLNGVGPVKAKVYNKGYRPLESGEGICADAEERVYIPAGPQGMGLGIHLRRGFAQAAEERVYIPAGPQVNVLGIHF